MTNNTSILVSGSGIGGLTSAVVLAQDGHAVTVRLSGGEIVTGSALIAADGKPRVSGHISCHAAGVQRELRNQMFQ